MFATGSVSLPGFVTTPAKAVCVGAGPADGAAALDPPGPSLQTPTRALGSALPP